MKKISRIFVALTISLLFVIYLKADFISLIKADECTNIVEMFIDDNSVRITFEIGENDFQWFKNIIPLKYYEGGFSEQNKEERIRKFCSEDFIVLADGIKLKGDVKKIERTKRILRASLYSGQVDSSRANEYIIFIEVEYKFIAKPKVLTFIPPLEEGKDVTYANIGFVTYHKKIPVHDIRYLGQAETLHLNWEDPWYSYFENKNLKRHHSSSLLSFLYIDPYEVRHEVLARVKDLEYWIDGIDYKMDDVLTFEDQEKLKSTISQYLRKHNIVTIDGKEIEPIVDKVHFVVVRLSGIQILDKVDNLDYSKYNVDLIVLAKEKSYLYDINKNVNVRYIYDTVGQLCQDYANGNFNLEFKREYDIEIGYLGIFTTWVIARFGNPKAKKITWLHGDFAYMVSGNTVEYVNDLYNRMDNIICVSNGVKQSFIDFAGNELENKLQTIYNPIDIYKIRKLSLQDIEYKKNKFTILSIARLSSEKGFDRLIRVHKKLMEEGIENELIILGSGGEEENLKKLIKDLKLEDTCKIIEYQKNPYTWIKMCDIFVSSSTTEALSLAIIEAMILEKPIVATDTHGSRALFKNNLGLMVGNSEEGLYYGLRNMILNKELRELYIKNLKKVDKFDFDKSIVMPEIEKLFDGGKI